MSGLDHQQGALKFLCRQCGKLFASRKALHVHRLQCEEQEPELLRRFTNGNR